jgi:hypothetical protein
VELIEFTFGDEGNLLQWVQLSPKFTFGAESNSKENLIFLHAIKTDEKRADI